MLPSGCIYSRKLNCFFSLDHYLFTQLSEVIRVSMAKSNPPIICLYYIITQYDVPVFSMTHYYTKIRAQRASKFKFTPWGVTNLLKLTIKNLRWPILRQTFMWRLSHDSAHKREAKSVHSFMKNHTYSSCRSSNAPLAVGLYDSSPGLTLHYLQVVCHKYTNAPSFRMCNMICFNYFA